MLFFVQVTSGLFTINFLSILIGHILLAQLYTFRISLPELNDCTHNHGRKKPNLYKMRSVRNMIRISRLSVQVS